MTIVRHFVRSPRYKFADIVKKMADDAKRVEREAGKRARAARLEEVMEEVGLDEYK